MFLFRLVLVVLATAPWAASAQQLAFKGNSITWNGQEVARLQKTDPEAELPGYEVIKQDGTLLLSALPSNWTQPGQPLPDQNVYSVLFQGVAEPVYLALNPTTAQTDLGNLMASLNLVNAGGIDAQVVHHLRKKHGLTGPETTALGLINRDRTLPLTLRKTGDVVQDGLLIGRVKALGINTGGLESYSIELPDGQRIATVNFSGGDGALEFTVETAADNLWHPVRRENPGNGRVEPGADLNANALLRILPWLVQKGYW
ncbi:MAG: hypothetical protein GC205_02755 [Bacteroidetes bacterium]|nr:hypothetical protein [Bacteroidota bacterium]